MVRGLMLLPLVVALIAACSSGDEDPTRTTNSTGDPTATGASAQVPRVTSAPETTATTAATEAPASTPTAAASPTLAATAAMASTSTPEPTATAEASPPDIQVGKYTLAEPNSIGAFTVDGYVENVGETAAQGVQVVVSFYDASGAILGSDDASVPFIIAAGAQAPFTAYVSSDSVDRAAVAETRILTQFEPFDPDSFDGQYYTLTFEVAQINWTGSGWAGEVTNTGDSTARSVAVYAAALDANGEVLFVNFGYADLEQLSSGLTSPFTIGGATGIAEPASTITYVIGIVV